MGCDTFVGLPTSTFTIIYVYGLSIFKRKSFFMREVTKRMNYFDQDMLPFGFGESLENILHLILVYQRYVFLSHNYSLAI